MDAPRPSPAPALHATRTWQGGAGALLVALLAAVAVIVSHGHAGGRRSGAAGMADTGDAGATLTAVATGNPPASRAPGADFIRDCLLHGGRYEGTAAQCDEWAEADVDRARQAEGLGDLRLPANFEAESSASQLVTVTDAERTSRGLPPLTQTSTLDQRASSAAADRTDPTGPDGERWVANWAGAYRTPLAADFAWMYDDGPGGTNSACTPSTAAGCWDHRDNILASFGGSMGASELMVGGVASATEVMVAA